MVDWKKALLCAKLSSIIYDTNTEVMSDQVTPLGCEFVGAVQSPGFQAMVVTIGGEQIVAWRGTPVTCARDLVDAIVALGYDLGLEHTNLPGGSKVLSGPYRTCLANWLRISRLLDLSKPITFTGHSLGAVCALISAALIDRDLSVIVFAPFQTANSVFWQATFGGRNPPVIIGRSCDFALGWNHLDAITCHASAIYHITGHIYRIVTSWPFFDDSVPDHSIDLYIQDVGYFADE